MGPSEKNPTPTCKAPGSPAPSSTRYGVWDTGSRLSSTHVLCLNVFLRIKNMCSLYLFTCNRAHCSPGRM